MPIHGQPADSPSLQEALLLLAHGHPGEAATVVTKAAKRAKAQSGSGSHPLACAYADMARFHYRIGDFKKAATEFRHASDSPMPNEPSERADRLAFMFGFAACLEALEKADEAEKVYRQCLEFAKVLHGGDSTAYAGSMEPLTAMLMAAGQYSEAVRFLNEAFAIVRKKTDPALAAIAAQRAEAFTAAGLSDDPFAELAGISEPLAASVVERVIERAWLGEAERMRRVLAGLLRFVERRFPEGHSLQAEALAAIVHHEAALGNRGDAAVRATAARRAIGIFAKTRLPAGLLDSLEIEFEPIGTLHLVPRLARAERQ